MTHVLVIDDDDAVRWVLQRNLEHAGFDVTTAVNGLDGVASIDDRAPDVVVLDLMMPVMDGFGVLEALQRDVRTARIPVVVLTAMAAPDMRARCEQAGARRVLTKPFEPSTLAAEINDVLARSAAEPIP
jgi:two-component system chemotaxis response regulator CheY